MWTFQHGETTTATPEQLWQLYQDPTTWSDWDHQIEDVTITGPLTPLFARVIGRKVADELPAAMRPLAARAERA